MKPLTAEQKDHLVTWLVLVGLAEILVVCHGSFRRNIFKVAAAGFWTGFFLRLLGCYPGKKEPAIVDFSSGFLSLLLQAQAGRRRKSISLFFPLVILPHVIYIWSHPCLGIAGWRRFWQNF